MRFWEYMKLSAKHPKFMLAVKRQHSKDELMALLETHALSCEGC